MKEQQKNRESVRWILNRSRRYLPAVAGIALIAGAISLSTVWMALLSKSVLDIATGAEEGSLAKQGLLLLAIVLFQVLLSGASSFMKSYVSGKMTISIRNYLFRGLVGKKYAKISGYHSGDLLNRITSDTEVIVGAVTSIIPNVISMVTKIIAGVGTLLILNRQIALLILLFGILVPLIGRIINKRYKHLHKEYQKAEGQARSFLQECFENIVVIKIFSSASSFYKKLNQYMSRTFKSQIKKTGLSVVASLGMYSFFTVGYYLVLLWGANALMGGTMTYGTLTAFLQLVSQLRAPLQNVSGIMPQYYSALASAERLMEIEHCENEEPPVSAQELEELKAEFRSIEVSHLSFSYDNEAVLTDCSFSVPAGRITAITGESGSGKSTLFKIMLGLYEPQAGAVTVNGTHRLNPSLRGLFAYVPQGNLVLSGSIRENITLCNDSIAEEDVIQAARAAEIYDYICSLPAGLDTVLAERGAGLSEGQIQRISIARALLVDAPVLLLDEATSALDESTETKVLSNIKHMTDKTVLFITHRNTSLKVCDKMIHVENKRFTELTR